MNFISKTKGSYLEQQCNFDFPYIWLWWENLEPKWGRTFLLERANCRAQL